MSKNVQLISLITLLLLLVGCNNTDINSNYPSETKNNTLNEIIEETEVDLYEKVVSNFSEITITEIAPLLLSSDGHSTYYFYFGRVNCVYCRKFVIENEIPLKSIDNFYYIDTKEFSEMELDLLEDYGVTVVPSILCATTNYNIELQDIDEFVKMVNG